MVVPVGVGDFFVGAGEGAFDKAGVADNVPVAVLVEFAAGGDERGGPDGAPFFVLTLSVPVEAAGEVDILDGDKVGIEAIDGLEGFAGGPEGGVGKAVFGKVGNEHETRRDDAEGPSFGEDKGAAADEFSRGQLFHHDAQEVRVEAGVGIDGHDDIAGGGSKARVADAGEVLGVLAGDGRPGFAGDGLGAVGAAVEHDHGLDLAGADLGRRSHCREASGEVVLLVVGGNDDGDFH